MIYARARITTMLSLTYDNYSQFMDSDTKDDLVINFHKKKYAEPTNQRLVKPIKLTIPADVIDLIEKMPSQEEFPVLQRLRIMIETFQGQVNLNEIDFNQDYFPKNY